MSLSAKTLLSLVAGMAAGLLTWGELFSGQEEPVLVGLTFGAVLGLVLGLVGAWAADARMEKSLSLALGLLGGAAGGVLGALLAAPITQSLAHSMHGLSRPAQAVGLALGQVSGWGVLGLALGGALGVARRTPRLAWQSAWGGLLGGLLGGVALAALPPPPLPLETPLAWNTWPSFSGPMALGGLIGLGCALVPWLGRQNWVRVHPAGREHLLARPVVSIGQDPSCDIRLRADPQVAPIHALIEAMPGGKHHLSIATLPEGRFAPVAVNTRPVLGEQWLADGDQITIGPHTLLFRERATRGALQLGPPQPQAWVRAFRPRAKPIITQTFAHPAPIAETASQEIARPAPAPAPPAPIPTLEPLPLLGLQSDMAALSLDEPTPDQNVPLSALPALLQGIVLRAEQGPYVGRAFVVDGTSITHIGRAIERELPLPMDKTVSRLHARIIPRGDDFLLEDADSANGTFANGLRLTGLRPLRPGDLIQVGSTVLRYS